MVDRALFGLSVYSLLASHRTGVLVVFVPLFLVEARGASVPTALALTSAAFVASAVVSPFAGRWSDRIGRRRPFLLAGELGALPIFLAVPLVPGYLLAGATIVAGTTVLSIGQPVRSAFVADLTRESERGIGYGLITAAQSVGSVSGFLIAGAVMDRFGPDALFDFVAAVMVASVVFLLTTVPDPRAPGTAPGSRAPTQAYLAVVVFSIAVSVRALGRGAVGAFYGLYATGLGATVFDVSLIAVAGLGVMAVTSVPFGKTVDRVGAYRGLRWGMLLAAGGLALFLVAPAWPYLVVAQAVQYLGYPLIQTGMFVWVARFAPTGRRGELFGVFNLVNSVLWSLGPVAGAAAYTFGGSPPVFLLAIATVLASLAAVEVERVRGFGREGRGTLTRPDPSSE